MILKSLSRKSSVQKLIKYIFKEQTEYFQSRASAKTNSKWYIPGVKLTPTDIKHLESEKQDAQLLAELKQFKGTVAQFIQSKLLGNKPEQKPFVIKQNIRARTIEGFCREFSENESRRLYTRSDQVAAYHVILSWSPQDASQITDAMLKDIAGEYTRLRGNNCLVVGTKHIEKEHIHLHLAVAGSLLNGKSSRQSKAEFQSIKEKLQEYQKDRYPFLSHSLPKHGNGKNKEIGVEKNKTPNAVEKQALLRCLDEVYATSTSKEHFLTQLQALGHVPYYRNGKFQGIRFNDERKYRIYRLGYDENKLLALDLRKAEAEKQLKELQGLRKGGRTIAKNRSNDIDGIHRALLYQETTDPKLQDKKRELQQELVNAGKEFENKNAGISETDSLNKAKPELANGHAMAQKEIPTERDNKENALQELQSIRDSSNKDIDMDASNDDCDSQIDREEDEADSDTDDESNARNLSDSDNMDDPDDAG